MSKVKVTKTTPGITKIGPILLFKGVNEDVDADDWRKVAKIASVQKKIDDGVYVIEKIESKEPVRNNKKETRGKAEDKVNENDGDSN